MSNYLTHFNVGPSSPYTVGVRSVRTAFDREGNRRTVLTLNSDKKVVLNEKSIAALFRAFGADSREWLTQPITVYRDTNAEGFPCVSVRAATDDAR